MTGEQRRAFIAENVRFPETTDLRRFAVSNHEFYGDSIRGYEFRRVIRSTLVWNAISGVGMRSKRISASREVFIFGGSSMRTRRWCRRLQELSEFLTSRDFANSVDPVTGVRPLHNTSTAGELVRFVLGSAQQAGVSRVVESGVPVSVINLNHPSSTTAIDVALAALNNLRPDPARGEIEQLISVQPSSIADSPSSCASDLILLMAILVSLVSHFARVTRCRV